MFTQTIASTVFTGPGANAVFKNITGDMILRDGTFLSTLRALVGPRIGEDSLLMHNEGLVNPLNGEALSDRVAVNIDDLDHGLLLFKCGSAMNPDGLAKAFEQKPGWVHVEKVSAFFKQVSMTVECFINPDRKASVVFVNSYDIRLMHYLQVGIIVFLPWYFGPENALTDDEKALVMSLREETPDHYLETLAKLAANYDFRTAMIRESLCGFEGKADRLRLTEVTGEIEQYNERLDSIEQDIRNILRELDELNTTRIGLTEKVSRNEAEGGEMMEYFLANRSLVLESCGDSEVDFTVLGHLTYWDEDYFKNMLDNDGSFLYTTNRHGIRKDSARKLLEAIFVQKRLKVRCCASYTLKMVCGVSGNSHHMYPPECAGYMPNPHIEYHGCLGNYRETLTELVRHHEYIGAIEQCIASARSLSWADISAQEFMSDFYKEETPAFIELPDGSVVTTRKAIAWLKEEK